jgi:aminoglycoside 3-N-acetyltransferase
MADKNIPVVTQKDIAAGLRQLGLRAGDGVFVHSSLSAFGKVTGGANAVIDAILEVIGPKGTAVFPTFTGVEPEKIGLNLMDIAPFTGIIPATARARPDFIRGTHPLYSFCAKGPLAQKWVDAEDKYIFPSEEKKGLFVMAEAGAKTMLLGCTHKSNSSVHLVSEFARVDYKIQDLAWWDLTVEEFLKLPRAKQADLLSIHMGEKLSYRPVHHYDAIDEPLRKAGKIKTVRIGNAQCHLMKIMDIITVGAAEAKKNPWFLSDKLGKA